MSWLHRLQQRLSITRNEALTLLSLSLFLLVGSVGRHACRQMRPVSPEYYAEIDSLFAHRSAAVLDPDAETLTEIRPLGQPTPAGEALPSDSLAEGPSGRPPTEQVEVQDRPGISPYTGITRDSESLPQADVTSASKTSPQAVRDSESKTSSLIDLNSATLSELEQLPRVGPKIAERIIAFRVAYGPFRSIDELSSVSGIGPKTLELIRPHATADSVR